jgi:hypothetical protein
VALAHSIFLARHHAAMSDAAHTASGFVPFVIRRTRDSFMLRS